MSPHPLVADEGTDWGESPLGEITDPIVFLFVSECNGDLGNPPTSSMIVAFFFIFIFFWYLFYALMLISVHAVSESRSNSSLPHFSVSMITGSP